MMITKLQTIDLESGYNKKLVLHRVSMEVKDGEIVAIIGPNGSGKSTLLKTVFGLLRTIQGKIIFNNKEVKNRSPHLNVKEGMSFIPQGSRVFTELSVMENLELGGYLISDGDELQKRLETVYEFFPVLKERKSQSASTLSGGEKQMLSLGRALMSNPELLLLDEPSLGLSPGLVKSVLVKIKEINAKFNTTIIIVEQKVHEVFDMADRVYVLRLGEIVFQGTPQELLKDNKIKEVFLT
jgi:branched-chain amino acid transport system ATP-binding protein